MIDPVTLLIIAGSAALNYGANRAAEKRQQQFASAMEAFQRGKSKQAMAATEALVKEQTPEKRATELADLTKDRTRSLRETVGAAQAFDAPGIAGKTSDDYARAQEAQAHSVADKTRRAIAQLAAMGAPGEQKQAHQLRFGKAAGVVDSANVASDAVGRGYMTDIGNVRPNPFALMLADIGMGYGLGRAMAPASTETLGSGLTPGTSGEGLRIPEGQGMSIGTGSGPGLKLPNDFARPWEPKLKNAFSLWGTT